MLVGQTHTPSVDAVLALFPRGTVLARMKRYLYVGYTIKR
jgi:hypothetical protein